MRINGIEYNQNHFNNIFYQSSNAPMTSVLARYPQVVASIKTIQDYLKTVESHLIYQIFDKKESPTKSRLHPCSATKWLLWWQLNICRAYTLPNWTEVPVSCVTDVSDVQMQRLTSEFHVNRVWNAINTRAIYFKNLAEEIGRAIAPNITHIEAAHSFLHFNRSSMQCITHDVIGHRIKPDSEHHTEVYMQNSPRGFFIPTSKRTIFVEYSTVVNGTLGHSLRMRLPLQELDSNGEHVWRTDATTRRRIVQKQSSLSTRYTPMTMAENPSIVLALEKADTFQQQIANVMLPSTLAILFLPLILSLIPISCFSYVTTIQMLGYILITDVLTVAPLGVKGIELMNIHSERLYCPAGQSAQLGLITVHKGRLELGALTYALTYRARTIVCVT